MAASSSRHDARQGQDVEHALAAGQQVDELAVRRGQDRPAVRQDQLGGGQVDAEFATQALDRLAGLLQFEAGVEQSLDDLELEHVAVGVPPLAAAIPVASVMEGRSRSGACPVVELAVGDADDGAHLGAPEAVDRTGRAACAAGPVPSTGRRAVRSWAIRSSTSIKGSR